MSYSPSSSAPRWLRHSSSQASRESPSPLSQSQRAGSLRASTSSVSSSPGTARPWNGSVSGGQHTHSQDDTTRQSNITIFEWTVTNVRALDTAIQTYSEDDRDSEHPSEQHEILKAGPVIGQGLYKLDVVLEPMRSDEPSTSRTPTFNAPTPSPQPSDSGDGTRQVDELDALWVYIGTLSAQSASSGHWESPASIMVGIKSIDEPVGSRHATTRWIYNRWQEDFVFHADATFCSCQLPALSTLLSHPAVNEHDAFVLVIQIHTPFVGERNVHPVLPHEVWIPNSIMTALENSLDNDKTGDVKFVTRERYDPSSSASAESGGGILSPASASPHRSTHRAPSVGSTSVASSVAASPTNPHPNMLSRKRVVWAHSDILKARSEFFETMLGGAFAEGSTTAHGHGRQVHEINLEGADFTTVYWLVKYLYTNSLEFDPVEDVRTIYQLATIKSSPHQTGRSEWEWQSVWTHPNRTASGGGEDDNQTIASSAVSSSAGSFEASRGPFQRGTSTSARSGVGPGASGGGGLGLLGSPPLGPGGRLAALPPVDGSRSSPSAAGRQQQQRAQIPHSHRPRGSSTTVYPASPSSIPVPSPRSSRTIGTSASMTATASRPSLSPPASLHHRASGHHLHTVPDPHSHPTAPPPPASALAVYTIASRYQLDELQDLARTHILSRLNLETAMPFLLATPMYDLLHSEILHWCLDHFEHLRGTEGFTRCFDEVSSGVWGDGGGRVLSNLCTRLSPERG